MPREPIWANDPEMVAELKKLTGGIGLTDFHAYMPMHNYIHEPTRMHWPAPSVNARIPPVKLTDAAGGPLLGDDGKQLQMSASSWLDRYRPVEQVTWAPGLPTTIPGRLIAAGGWLDHPDANIFNFYRPPSIEPGDATRAGPWLAHVRLVYPADAEHILKWLAHRVQRPDQKINHALVLGGGQGIGKDTILEPVKYAVGAWNFSEVSPAQVLGRFNGYLKAVIVRISEARDLGESDRYKFYAHLKTMTATPPDTLLVDEKNLKEYLILNCCGVIITTNHRLDGVFLPDDDRRNFVAWSELTLDHPAFHSDYWKQLYAWYEDGGKQHVAAWLAQHDISGFDPAEPPPKTSTFWAIVDANRAPEDAEIADVLDTMGKPDVFALGRLRNNADGEIAEWLKDRRNWRAIPHRLESCGYALVRNPSAKDGLWKIYGKRQAIYARCTMAQSDQLTAAMTLVR